MTAPSIKEALELARKYIQEELDQDSPWSLTGRNAVIKAIDAALATLQPSGERREAIALAEMVYKAIKFTDEAAGEGICFEDLDPALILCDYAQAIGTDCWDGMAEVARDAILASGLVHPLVSYERREAIARIIVEHIEVSDAALEASGGVAAINGIAEAADAILASGLVQDEAGISQKLFDRAIRALEELTAVVRGECPSLLNEGSGGDGELSVEIDEIIKEADAIRSARDGGAES